MEEDKPKMVAILPAFRETIRRELGWIIDLIRSELGLNEREAKQIITKILQVT